jgi:hypothetical protein
MIQLNLTPNGIITANFFVEGTTGNPSGNSTVGNMTVTGNANVANLNVTANANLGSNSNVKITGGTPGQVLSTIDGLGNLQWITGGGGGGSGTVTSVATGGSGLGFSLSGGPITTTGTVTLNAPSATALRTTLNIGNVANLNLTGATTTWLRGDGTFSNIAVPTVGNIAVLNLDGNAGNVLSGAGTWIAAGGGGGGSGTVTSVVGNGSGLGFSLSGTVTTSGNITLAAPTDLQLRTTLNIGNVANLNLNGDSTTFLAGDGSWLTGGDEPIANAVILSTNNPTGFDEAFKLTSSAISFNNTTRTFTIQPAGTYTQFDVWVKGKQFSKIGPQTITIPNTTGAHYIYFAGASATLTTSTTVWDIANVATIAYVYWNSDLNSAQMVFDERHGTSMDPATHEYLHRTRGASISKVPAVGFAITATTSGDGNSNGDAQIGLSSGTFFDEDIRVDIVNTATPTANTWQQNLTNPGRIPVLYRSGTAWVLDVATTYPMKFGVARPTYNLNTGGNWSTPDVPNNHYFVQWVCATNNLNSPVMSIMGQNQYNNLGDAQVAKFSDLDLTGIPIAELRPLYSLVLQTSTSYTNVIKARLRDYSDDRLDEVATVVVTSSAIDVAFRETPGTVFADDASANAAWNSVIGNFAGNINYTGANVTIGPVANVRITGGSAGQYLQTNGSGTLSWATVTVPTVAGSNTQVQFNNNGAFGASSNLTFDGNTLVVAGNVTTNGLLDINYATESVGIIGAQTGTYAFDLLSNSFQYSTANSTANITVNFRGNSTVAANTVLSNAQSIVGTFVMTSGATAHTITAVQIDGSAQTIRWAGGSAPTANANSTNAFTFTLIKTATTPTYTVLGSMTRFA